MEACHPAGYVGAVYLENVAIPALAAAIQTAHDQALVSRPISTPRRKAQDSGKKIVALQARKEREIQLYREGLVGFDEMRLKVAAIDAQIAGVVPVNTALAPIGSMPSDLLDAWGDSSESERGALLRSFLERCEVDRDNLTAIFRDPSWSPDGSGRLTITRSIK